MIGSSTKHLPENFRHYKTLDLHDYKLTIVLNLVAILVLVATINIFDNLVNLLRPEISGISFNRIRSSPNNILYILGMSIVVIVVHELIHAAFFWINTREIPVFAIKLLYAYAAAPEWYIPRINYLIIGLSPAVFITLIVIIFLLIVPPSLLMFISVAGIINLAGSTGDFAVIIWALIQPKDSLLRDSGDTFDVYHKSFDNEPHTSSAKPS